MRRDETILVVDDTAENLRLLSSLLAEQGYRVRVAPDGPHALASIDRALPDLVLLDVMMPAMDGYEVCRRLKEREVAREVPVIFLSALNEVKDKVRALEAGGVDYVSKPFQSEEVLARIETQLALARARRGLRRRNRQLTVLGALSQSLQRCPREEDTCGVVAAAAAQLFPGSRGAVFLTAEGGDEPVPATWGEDDPAGSPAPPGKSERPSREHLREALDRGMDVLAGSSEHGLAGAALRVGLADEGRRLLVPVGPSATGAILVLDPGGGVPSSAAGARAREFAQEHGAVLVQLVEHYAVSLESLRLRERLRREAIVDPLTGLFNRRHMEAVVEREAYRARRREKAVGLILCDIDRFKRINDTHGHDAGDEILRCLGAQLRGSTRGEDIACRYGGEEFLLILPEIDPGALRRRAEGILAEARGTALPWQGATLAFSLSAGMSLWSGDTDFASAIRAADAALYRAKEGGRDRAVGP